MLLVAALSCQPTAPGPSPASGRAYAEALAQVAAAPGDAIAVCAAVDDDALRADCLSAGAEALAQRDAAAAATLCAAIAPGVWRDECGFQVAERSGDAAHCALAGRFSEDCRMHLWSARVARSLADDATPAQAAAELAAPARDAGFAPDDPRPWIATFRLLGARMRPLDRSGCAAIPDDAVAAVCKDALRDHFNDRLNHARDTGGVPCGTSPPWPGPLAYVQPDPGLDALVADRIARDLCP